MKTPTQRATVWIRRSVFTLIALLSVLTGRAQFQTPEYNPNMWVTNGSVSTISRSGNSIYLGGSFTRVGPNTGGGSALSLSTGQSVGNALHVNGTISVSVSDGNGGWYIGGKFSSVGHLLCSNIAHILADNSLDTNWTPNANNDVNALELDGNTLYVGGSFSSIGGQVRLSLASLNVTTGLSTSWNPQTNGTVNAIKVIGNLVYVGGTFRTIGGQSRNRIAAVHPVTGLAQSWNPDANSTITKLASNGTTLYVVGGFTSIGGQTRSRIAALDLSSGTATSWNPAPNSSVLAIAVDGNNVYVGGSFTSIGGQTRNRIAALDAVTGAATSWTPVLSTGVYAIAIHSNTVYIGGLLNTVGGQTRSNIAAIDQVTGDVTSWDPGANAIVNTLSVSGSSIYAGGVFNTIGGVIRNRIAAFDATTGMPTSWDPNCDASVSTLIVKNNKVYACGSFSTVGGQARKYIAAIDAITGMPTSWDPNSNSSIDEAILHENTLLVAGVFTTIGGQSRNYLAAIDTLTGAASAWNPDPSGRVNKLLINQDILYIGGQFVTIFGQTRRALAAYELTTGTLTNWNPDINGSLNDIAVLGNDVYVGGSFTTVGVQTRRHLAAIDKSTGLATTWNPNPDNAVRSLFILNNSIFVGGSFENIGGQSRTALAEFETSTGLVTPWNSYLSYSQGTCIVHSIDISNNTIYIGGSWDKVGSLLQNRVASLSLSTTCPPEFKPTIIPSGPTTFCTGGSVTLTAPAGSSYLWSTNQTNLSITISTPGSYSLRTIANGCTSKASRPIVVSINTPPSTPTISSGGPTTFCSGGSVTLTAPAGFSYLWSTNETTQSINVTTAGSYTVQTIASGCTSSASAATVVTVTACNAKIYTGIGNWTDAANWSGGTLPVAGDSVFVAPLSSLTMNTTATVKSLTVAAGATLTMNTTSDLTVTNVANNLGTVANVMGLTGTLRLGGGSFPVEFKGNKWTANRVILLSNAKANADMDIFGGLDLNGQTFNANSKTIALRFQALHTAELLQPAGSAITNATNFRVDKRYPVSLSTIGTNGGAWILVGAPTSNQNVNTWSQGNFYAYSWQNGIYNGSSIYTYDPFYTLPLSRGYKKPTGPTQPAPIGVGHRVWFRYNEFFLGPNQGGQSHTGVPLIGNFNWNLAYCTTGCADTTAPYGYNMIANPYAATIDWDAPTGWTRINVHNAHYIHKSLAQNVASYVGSVGNNGGSRYLPVGQGFFVWANNASTVMSATPDIIAPGMQVAQHRSGQVADVLRLSVLNGSGFADEAVIRFDQRATPQFDNQLEARKMSNFSGLNLSFVDASTDRFAIMAENLPTAQTIYPLNLSVPQSGNYQIQFDGMATLTNNWSVFLKDNTFNALIPVQDGQAYSFNESAGTTNRFSLVVMPNGPTSLASNLKLVMNLVPNPAKDVVRVNLSQATTGMMTVTNQIGQVVISEQVNGQSHELNVSKLAKGIYHVAIGGVVTKLVVE